jgi:hypothetical protein
MERRCVVSGEEQVREKPIKADTGIYRQGERKSERDRKGNSNAST